MTHGDGGKGSARRKENAQAILNNWDLIFNKTHEMLELEAGIHISQQEEKHGVREDTPTMPELRKQ
jgi:hypothetical protein